jgi:hypothetical protein
MPNAMTNIKYDQEVIFSLTNIQQMFLEPLHVPGSIVNMGEITFHTHTKIPALFIRIYSSQGTERT